MNKHDAQQKITRIALSRLRAHGMNSNVMSEALMGKLVGHIGATGNYPPLIVRRVGADSEGDDAYEVLDGHHRWAALRRLGHTDAACVVWDVDDAGALVLLSTLNRLRGADDPRRRAELLERLRERLDADAARLAKLVPETTERVQKLLATRTIVSPRAPRGLGEMPVAVHFFLSGEQRRRLDDVLERLENKRETALMRLVAMGEEHLRREKD